MKEFIYGWIRDIAFYAILMTVILHLLPEEGQKKYVRFFMGIVLMLVVLSPLLSVAGLSGTLDSIYAEQTYDEELQDFTRRQAELEEEARRLLAEQCQAVLSILQAQQCDAIGIGSSIYRHHPALWRQVQDRWPEIFSDYPIEVRVKIREMRWGRVWNAKNLEEWEIADYGK